MIIDLSSWGTLELALVALGGAALVALGLVAHAWRRRAHARRRAQARMAELAAGEAQSLHAEIRALGATLVELAARFDRLEQAIAIDSRHRADVGKGALGEAGYELGVRLARAGARSEEIVAACGMRPDEAALLLRLHARAA